MTEEVDYAKCLEVALDGPWAMVGAPDLAAVFPYELVGTQWVAKAAIENKEAAAFGIAIALDGTRALLGSLDDGVVPPSRFGPSDTPTTWDAQDAGARTHLAPAALNACTQEEWPAETPLSGAAQAQM